MVFWSPAHKYHISQKQFPEMAFIHANTATCKFAKRSINIRVCQQQTHIFSTQSRLLCLPNPFSCFSRTSSPLTDVRHTPHSDQQECSINQTKWQTQTVRMSPCETNVCINIWYRVKVCCKFKQVQQQSSHTGKRIRETLERLLQRSTYLFNDCTNSKTLH